jgi:hypothetical protein
LATISTTLPYHDMSTEWGALQVRPPGVPEGLIPMLRFACQALLTSFGTTLAAGVRAGREVLSVAASEEEGGAFQLGAEGVQAVSGMADVG